MTAPTKKPRKVRKSRRRATVMLRFEKGRIVPADAASARMLRERDYRIGDVVSAELRKPRNPKFHRMVHALGTALIENTDDFANYTDSHMVLKRLQVEANVGCDVMLIHAPGYGMLEHRTPRSLSFESMDEAEFQQVYKGFCEYISRRYLPGMDPADIERMAELVGTAG